MEQLLNRMDQPNENPLRRKMESWVAWFSGKMHQVIICKHYDLNSYQGGPLHSATAVEDVVVTFENMLALAILFNIEQIR